MSRARSMMLVLAVLALSSRAMRAQTESVADLLLRQAQTALNSLTDVDRARAETLARQVLEQMSNATAVQKQKARIILANVYFPEEAPDKRKRSQALAVLSQAVRADLDVTIDRDLTYPGLDSLLAEAKRTTYAIAVKADSQQVVAGPAGQAEIRVRASRPTVFRLVISQSAGSAALLTDSTDAAPAATLHFLTMRNERPIFTTGDYDVLVTATDPRSGDTTSARYVAHITAPELTFAKIPVGIDSSRLQLERSGRYGSKGIVVGALVAGGIYAFSSVLSADTSLKRVYPSDSKGVGVAAAVGAAVIIASFVDKGRPVPGAIVANQRLRDDLGAAIRAAEAENANRIATYRTTIAIQTGAR